MENFTINLFNLHVPSLAEFPHLPPADDSAAQKRLYWFFRGLEEMASKLYERIEMYQHLEETLDEEEETELEDLNKGVLVVLAAVNWAGRLYGGMSMRMRFDVAFGDIGRDWWAGGRERGRGV